MSFFDEKARELKTLAPSKPRLENARLPLRELQSYKCRCRAGQWVGREHGASGWTWPW